jgi:putative heme-binding domain-containing protein
MRGFLFGLVLLLGVASIATPRQLPDASAAKRFVWQSASPESQGMSKEKLDALKDELARRKTKALLVIRNDKIVCEWYADGHGPDKRHYTASLAKAIVGGLSLGVALSDGKIALDDPASRYVTQWKADPRKSRITLRQLGAHTSGLEDAEQDRLPHERLTGWKGDFWKALEPPSDPFTIARDLTPVLIDPGQKLQYSNPGIAMLTYCVTAAIQEGEHKDVRTLLRERVMRPIGVPDAEWLCGYGKTFTVEGLPLVGSWGGGSYTARAVGRIGRLLLRQGDWNGTRILSKEAVRQITGDAGLPGSCGMGFWTNAAGRYAKLPKDACWGAGAGDQVLLLIPSLNLIVVRNGETLAPPPADAKEIFEEFHDARVRILFEPLIEVISDGSVRKADPNVLRQSAMNSGGDAKRGKEIFNSEAAKCGVCHKVHGQGGEAGPDLSQVGGKLDRTHLIEALLDPSAEIMEGYRTTVIATADGRILTGIVRSETPAEVTLVDAEGKTTTFATRDIESRRSSNVSLMPAGLADGHTPADFSDLIAYLETLRTGRKPTPGEGVTGTLALPPGFTADLIASGLTGVTALEVASDGRVFVCEQTGALRVVKDGQLLPEPFVTLPVDATWERGLIGVTVAPDFPKAPYVFVCYVAAKPYPHHVVSRFTAAGDVAQPGSERILFKGDDQTKLGGNIPAGHQGGALHFGVDGKLYLAIGEQTAGTPAQDLNSLLGKLLRINPDGSIPDDNPFVTKTKGKYRAIWAYGLRNPFAFAVQPATGRIFINDVGGNAEEINEGVAGANYGWPVVEHGPTANSRFRAPLHYYPTACITGGAFASRALPWPAEYRGRYFFADFNHGWIKTIDPENPGTSETFVVGIRRPVDLRFAADGSLLVLVHDAWVIDGLFKSGTGALLRIRYRATSPRPSLSGSVRRGLGAEVKMERCCARLARPLWVGGGPVPMETSSRRGPARHGSFTEDASPTTIRPSRWRPACVYNQHRDFTAATICTQEHVPLHLTKTAQSSPTRTWKASISASTSPFDRPRRRSTDRR